MDWQKQNEPNENAFEKIDSVAATFRSFLFENKKNIRTWLISKIKDK